MQLDTRTHELDTHGLLLVRGERAIVKLPLQVCFGLHGSYLLLLRQRSLVPIRCRTPDHMAVLTGRHGRAGPTAHPTRSTSSSLLACQWLAPVDCKLTVGGTRAPVPSRDHLKSARPVWSACNPASHSQECNCKLQRTEKMSAPTRLDLTLVGALIFSVRGTAVCNRQAARA